MDTHENAHVFGLTTLCRLPTVQRRPLGSCCVQRKMSAQCQPIDEPVFPFGSALELLFEDLADGGVAHSTKCATAQWDPWKAGELFAETHLLESQTRVPLVAIEEL